MDFTDTGVSEVSVHTVVSVVDLWDLVVHGLSMVSRWLTFWDFVGTVVSVAFGPWCIWLLQVDGVSVVPTFGTW